MMNFHYDKKDESFTPKISIHGIPAMCVLEEKSVEIFLSSAHVEISPLLRFTSERNRDECSVYIPVKILGFIS